jgi:hypothetical protein
MENELSQIIDPLKQSLASILAMHGGGLISASFFTAAADVIFEKLMGKKHPMWLLIVYAIVIGILYRGYTTNWIYHITPIASVAVVLIGAGYGIMGVGAYFSILKPLKGGAVQFLKAKFKIK